MPEQMPEDETIEIGSLTRIAFDRRPPSSRRVQKAEGHYGEPQPHHQRVRIDHAERLGHSLDDIPKKENT